MNTAISIIVGIFTAAAATYLAYLAQSRRDARILWKNRNRFLYKKMFECLSLAKIESEHLSAWKDAVNENPYNYPQLKQASGTQIIFNILAEKVMLDEYYFAYNRLFLNYLKAEELYYDLQYGALHLKAIYEQSFTMIEGGQQRSYNRGLEALGLYNQAIEWVNTRIQTCSEAELPYMQKFKDIHREYLRIKGEEQSANLPEIFTHYFSSCGTFINANGIPDSLIPFGELMNKFFPLYHSIEFQNLTLAKEIDDNNKAFNEALGSLKKVVQYWKENFEYNLNN